MLDFVKLINLILLIWLKYRLVCIVRLAYGQKVTPCWDYCQLDYPVRRTTFVFHVKYQIRLKCKNNRFMKIKRLKIF